MCIEIKYSSTQLIIKTHTCPGCWRLKCTTTWELSGLSSVLNNRHVIMSGTNLPDQIEEQLLRRDVAARRIVVVVIGVGARRARHRRLVHRRLGQLLGQRQRFAHLAHVENARRSRAHFCDTPRDLSKSASLSLRFSCCR